MSLGTSTAPGLSRLVAGTLATAVTVRSGGGGASIGDPRCAFSLFGGGEDSGGACAMRYPGGGVPLRGGLAGVGSGTGGGGAAGAGVGAGTGLVAGSGTGTVAGAGATGAWLSGVVSGVDGGSNREGRRPVGGSRPGVLLGVRLGSGGGGRYGSGGCGGAPDPAAGGGAHGPAGAGGRLATSGGGTAGGAGSWVGPFAAGTAPTEWKAPSAGGRNPDSGGLVPTGAAGVKDVSGGRTEARARTVSAAGAPPWSGDRPIPKVDGGAVPSLGGELGDGGGVGCAVVEGTAGIWSLPGDPAGQSGAGAGGGGAANASCGGAGGGDAGVSGGVSAGDPGGADGAGPWGKAPSRAGASGGAAAWNS